MRPSRRQRQCLVVCLPDLLLSQERVEADDHTCAQGMTWAPTLLLTAKRRCRLRRVS